MSHISLPRLGHLTKNNNYDSPASSPPHSSDTSGPEDDETSTPELVATHTSAKALKTLESNALPVTDIISNPKISQKSVIVPIEPITDSSQIESAIGKDSGVLIAPVKRKHHSGKHYFQEFRFKRISSILELDSSRSSQFFGFYTLFWLSVGLFVLRTLIHNYRAGTSVSDFAIVKILRKDLFKVAATDLAMYLVGYFCVALQWAIGAGYIRWRSSGWIIQNVFQTLFLFFFIWLARYREYPWIGCVYLLLHSLVLIMKMHSYAFFNGYLWNTLEDLKHVEGRLKKLQDEDSKDTTSIDELLELRKFLRVEIDSQSTVRPFPSNLTVFNYFEYSMFPTLVYQIDYPRTSSINWSYVGEKVCAVFGVYFLMIVLAEKYLYPIAIKAIALSSKPFSEKVFEYPLVLLDLTLPFVLMYLLVFYIIWDAILNAIAELTCFSDREFYGPWWNSVTWDQFARDWNVPVHRFLLRHVYHSSISTFNVSKTSATLITFLLSSCVHELAMYVIFRRLRGYLLFLQMCQLPLVALSRTRYMRNQALLGNVIFWFGIMTGPSLMCSLYLMF